MMPFSHRLIVSIALAAVSSLATGASLRTIAEVKRCQTLTGSTNDYVVTALVISADDGSFIGEDATGRTIFSRHEYYPAPKAGDILEIRGKVIVKPSGEPWVPAGSARRLGTAPLPPPADMRLNELDRPENDLKRVAVTGTVLDVCTDEIDPSYQVVFLKENGLILPLVFKKAKVETGEGLIDARVRTVGIYTRAISGIRKFSGPVLLLDSRQAIAVVTPPPDDPFGFPPLEKRLYLTPREVSCLGKRTVAGRVIAVWNERHLMIRETDGRIVNAELADGETLPAVGTAAVFAGHPETDLFHLNLTRARCKPAPVVTTDDERPEETTASHLISRSWHRPNGELYHGALLRLTGTVRSVQAARGGDRHLLLSDGNYDVPVNLSACPQVADSVTIGCTISATGRCVLDQDNWRPDRIFPQIRGFTLVLRAPEDVRVLSRPSWWTPLRLTWIIALLLVALVGVYIRNRLLRRISAVKLGERTQLAVELHDSLSQSLAGLACLMTAAKDSLSADPTTLKAKLTTAEQMLGSCRTELRNCLFDLRNDTMGEKTFDAAIRRTLEPFAEQARLTVRFNAPRAPFDDSTIHAVLAIVRELTANAIRHGHATDIRIAGAVDRESLRFSVTDNGRGFDPSQCPGSDDGHFGLDGIRERAERADGRFAITSTPGHGAKAVFKLPLQRP